MTDSKEPGEQASEVEAETPSLDSIAEGSDPGIVREFIWFLKYNKKWWLTPIVLVLLALVALAFTATTPMAPFIYTLF